MSNENDTASAKPEGTGTELEASAVLQECDKVPLKDSVVADAVTATIFQPNYPIMVTPNAHEDSLEDTSPFDFIAATYFIPMTALFGVGLASVVIGGVSDKIGRRPCVLVCLYGSVVLSIAKYFLRHIFWGFCAVNFANGLFSATTPLAMAYVSDVF